MDATIVNSILGTVGPLGARRRPAQLVPGHLELEPAGEDQDPFGAGPALHRDDLVVAVPVAGTGPPQGGVLDQAEAVGLEPPPLLVVGEVEADPALLDDALVHQRGKLDPVLVADADLLEEEPAIRPWAIDGAPRAGPRPARRLEHLDDQGSTGQGDLDRGAVARRPRGALGRRAGRDGDRDG